MSKEKIAVNVYGVLDNELERMHELLRVYMSMPKHPDRHMSAHYSNSQPSHGDLGTIYKRIIDMQQIMLTALASHDKNIQEKVAELALTGVGED